jgi:hypothetical protein
VIELLVSAVECKWGSGVRQTEIHTGEPLLPELSAFVAEIAIEKLRSYRSSDNDEISVELIQTGGEVLGPTTFKGSILKYYDRV